MAGSFEVRHEIEGVAELMRLLRRIAANKRASERQARALVRRRAALAAKQKRQVRRDD